MTGVYRINGVPISTSQTPWTQDIDGAGFKLKNVSGIGIGVTNALYPLQIHEAANQNLVLRLLQLCLRCRLSTMR